MLFCQREGALFRPYEVSFFLLGSERTRTFINRTEMLTYHIRKIDFYRIMSVNNHQSDKMSNAFTMVIKKLEKDQLSSTDSSRDQKGPNGFSVKNLLYVVSV